jgi:heme exporter protein C
MAAILVWPLTFLLPRYLGGLHPGAEGTPAFCSEDISPLHRIVFYLAVVGFVALGVWIWMLRVRLSRLEERITTYPDLPAEAA